MTRTALRICPLCEATCGLTLTIDDGRVTGARGDRDDVFSAGFICPKGASFAELDDDPDRLTRPLVRRDGVLTEATWDEAFAAVADGSAPSLREHGGTSVGVYLGNPNAHTIAGACTRRWSSARSAPARCSRASTLDQMPKHVALGLMFGNPFAFTVPDLDRTDHLVIIGANPLVSNGSLATAADFPGKLRALRKRGGRLTVIDPARTRTAELADRHLAPRPGTDAALLFAVVHVLFDEGLVARLGGLAEHVNGVDDVRALAADFAPEAVAAHCGVAADEIRALARELAAAPTAAVYGRIGTSTVEFGTLGSWLVDVVNVLTGNLDRPGGAMFPLGAGGARAPPAGAGPRLPTGRWHSRVSGHPEAQSELPAAALAEEIDTPGDGQIRALITIAGNPVLSAPDGDRLDRALDGVDFMVSVDPYLNETTRHADVILPPPPPSQSAHFDFALNNLAVRNNVRYSPPVLPLRRAARRGGDPVADRADPLRRWRRTADPALVDEQVIATTLAKETADPDSPVAGRPVDELTAMLAAGPGYERRLDMMLRLGPYGDAFGARPDGLTLRAAQGRARTASTSVRCSRGCPRCCEHQAGNRARARAAGRRRRAAARGARPGRRRLRADRPAAPALQQQLDAQRACAGRRHEPVHPADPPRRRRRPRPRRTPRWSRGPAASWWYPSSVPTACDAAWCRCRTAGGTTAAAPARGRGRPARRQRQPAQRRHALDPLSGTAVLNGIPVHIAPAG